VPSKRETEAARAELAQREAQLNWERQASAEEKQLNDAFQTWENWAKSIPELMDFKELANTRVANPARYNEIMKRAQRGKQFQEKLIARSKELFELRKGRELLGAVQQHEQATTARSQYNAAQDARFEQLVAKELPEFSKGNARLALNQAAREELRSYGMSDQQIAREFNHGQLRSAEAQMMLAKAATQRLIKENRIRMASKRAPIPPVQTPGTSRPRGAGDMERVRQLETKLAGAKGTGAVKIAQQLTQAKRAAGML
jgi:hypothetical protein